MTTSKNIKAIILGVIMIVGALLGVNLYDIAAQSGMLDGSMIQTAYAQYGQADLDAYLQHMPYPTTLPADIVEQLNDGVPTGSYGDILLSVNTAADPMDTFGILNQSIPEQYMTYDPSYDYAKVSEENPHTYIIIERGGSMSADPNLILGLQTQVTTLAQQHAENVLIVVGGVIATTISVVGILALRGQGAMLSGAKRALGRGGDSDSKKSGE